MQQVTVTDLAALLQELAEDDAPVLLDVREPWEVQLSSFALPGVRTVCIPMQQIPERLGELDPSHTVLSLCHHGARSLQVAAFLERQGFQQVVNIAGGIDAWSREVDTTVPRY